MFSNTLIKTKVVSRLPMPDKQAVDSCRLFRAFVQIEAFGPEGTAILQKVKAHLTTLHLSFSEAYNSG